MALAEVEKLSYEDYLSLPDDGRRYELLDGVLAVTPAPIPRHQRILIRFLKVFLPWGEETKAGEFLTAPIDVHLSEHTVVQPDILFIRRERCRIIGETRIDGAPDLIVEILSPATSRRDKTTKRQTYARHGVREYWLVSPEAETIQVLVLDGHEYREHQLVGPTGVLRSTVLEGLEISAAKVFAD